MKKIFKNGLLILLLAAAGFGASPFFASGADGNYITLSSYYVFPGQSVKVMGNRFEPNQVVNVSVGGMTQTLTANNTGSFTSADFTIPFSFVNSSIGVSVAGNLGESASATLTVGNFYPVATPNSWYLPPGGQINFNGSGFAPNETVRIKRGNTTITAAKADSFGVFYSKNFRLPYIVGDVKYTLTGQNSGANVDITVHSAKDHAYLVLNNYHPKSAANIQISGFSFGADESVVLTYETGVLATVTTSASGRFVFRGKLPVDNLAGAKTLTATGLQSGKRAQIFFSLAK